MMAFLVVPVEGVDVDFLQVNNNHSSNTNTNDMNNTNTTNNANDEYQTRINKDT